jgi:endo-1,4-beta-mannosidase
VKKRLFTLTSRWLLYPFFLLLLSLPLPVFVPQRPAEAASQPRVQTLLDNLKELNYYPEYDAWTNMWTRFHPTEIDQDFARIQGLGFNTVRIILQATPGAFDYPAPTSAELQQLVQVVTLAATHHLQVHLTLFDAWDQYTDIVGSQQWADAIVKPYAADPRVSIIEVQNEMPLTPDSLTWAQMMIPYVQSIDGGIPVTISESGLSRLQQLVQALYATAPDFYDFHDYEYDGQFYQTLTQVNALLDGAQFLLGETGYSTYPQSPQGFAGTAHNTVAQEAQQEYYYRMLVYATNALGLPFPAPWIYSDFSLTAFPNPPQPGTLFQAYFGVFRLDGSEKPAAETIANLLSGNPVDTSFNNGFEQGDGQGSYKYRFFGKKG